MCASDIRRRVCDTYVYKNNREISGRRCGNVRIGYVNKTQGGKGDDMTRAENALALSFSEQKMSDGVRITIEGKSRSVEKVRWMSE